MTRPSQEEPVPAGARDGSTRVAPPRALLRRSLVAGGLYDLVLGLFVVTAGPWTMARLGHPLRDPELFYFRLAALPLCILPIVYLTASRSPHLDAFRIPVLGLRGLGGALLILALLLKPEPAWLFPVIGLFDLGWAALHATLWRRSD